MRTEKKWAPKDHYHVTSYDEKTSWLYKVGEGSLATISSAIVVLKIQVILVLVLLLLSACTPPGMIVGMISEMRTFDLQDSITFKDPINNFDKMSADAITPSGFRVSGRAANRIQYNKASGFFEKIMIGKIEDFTIAASLSDDQKTVDIVAVVVGNLGTADEESVRKVIDEIKNRFASMGVITPEATEAATDRQESRRPCVSNFSKTGSSLTGHKFVTFEVFSNVQRAVAYEKILGEIAKGGWQITSSNKEAGVISAFQNVRGGSGKTVPLNAIIAANPPSDVRVDLVFQLSGGLRVKDADVLKDFCQILGSVSGMELESKSNKP